MEENYGAKKEDIILYGQSVGSGRTLDLASRLPRLRDVVLHSPILSGLRVMYHVKRTYWFDIYKVKFFISCLLDVIWFENYSQWPCYSQFRYAVPEKLNPFDLLYFDKLNPLAFPPSFSSTSIWYCLFVSHHSVHTFPFSNVFLHFFL